MRRTSRCSGRLEYALRPEGRHAQRQARSDQDDGSAASRGRADLRASGILDRVVKVGERAPDFTLPSIDGVPVSLAELLVKGPVVLSFFRGRW